MFCGLLFVQKKPCRHYIVYAPDIVLCVYLSQFFNDRWVYRNLFYLHFKLYMKNKSRNAENQDKYCKKWNEEKLLCD